MIDALKSGQIIKVKGYPPLCFVGRSGWNEVHNFIFETEDGAIVRVTKRWLLKYAKHNFVTSKNKEFNKILVQVINGVSERLRNTRYVIYANV